MSTTTEPATAERAASPPRRRISAGAVMRLTTLLLVAALVVGFTTQWDRWTGAAVRQTTDDAYVQADLTPLSAKVAGYVRAVPVQDFERVHQGELLVQIVDDDYRAQVQQSIALVAGAQSAIDNLQSQKLLQQANIAGAEANLKAAQATYVRNHLEAVRQRELVATRIAGTQQLVEQADAAEQQAAAQVAQANAQVLAAQRQLEVLDAQEQAAKANLMGQEAALDLAKINLGYTRITAPADGVAGQRQVRPGQYVSVGSQVVSVVPLPHVWVTANYKETQLTNVRVGQPVRLQIDSFPGAVLSGHVESISPASGSQFSLLPADNATGNFTKVVQRIPVKIVLDDAAGLADLLRPGMSVVTTIQTDGSPVTVRPIGK